MDKETAISILITDDHRIFRESLRFILEKKANFKVIGEAENGLIAVRKTKQLRPDVILMDIRMPVLDGVEATRLIKKEYPQIIIIGLSNHSDAEYKQTIIKAGASDYLLKSINPKELVQSIQQAYFEKEAA